MELVQNRSLSKNGALPAPLVTKNQVVMTTEKWHLPKTGPRPLTNVTLY